MHFQSHPGSPDSLRLSCKSRLPSDSVSRSQKTGLAHGNSRETHPAWSSRWMQSRRHYPIRCLTRQTPGWIEICPSQSIRRTMPALCFQGSRDQMQETPRSLMLGVVRFFAVHLVTSSDVVFIPFRVTLTTSSEAGYHITGDAHCTLSAPAGMPSSSSSSRPQ